MKTQVTQSIKFLIAIMVFWFCIIILTPKAQIFITYHEAYQDGKANGTSEARCYYDESARTQYGWSNYCREEFDIEVPDLYDPEKDTFLITNKR